MRDINRAIEHVERVMTRALDRPSREPKAKPPKIHAWRAPTAEEKTLMLTARSIKVSVPLDPAAVGALCVPNQPRRIKLAVSCEGNLYSADISAKSVRKAQATIGANGADKTYVMIQGKLKGNEIIECGIIAFPVNRGLGSLAQVKE